MLPLRPRLRSLHRPCVQLAGAALAAALAPAVVAGCGDLADETAGPVPHDDFSSAYGPPGDPAARTNPPPSGHTAASLDRCRRRTCSDHGAMCGNVPDGCGGFLDCGRCPAGQVCGGGGFDRCGSAACIPTTCAKTGSSCGSISDGCGNVVDCGSCPPGQTCSNNACGCAPTTCAKAGATCGSISDGCGKVLDCGSCQAGTPCVNNTCACTPTNCAKAKATCGSVSDGCGKVLDCGSCPSGQSCKNNLCCGTKEICGNGIDDDCDGKVDEGCKHPCEDEIGGNCNGDAGWGDHCDASENTHGCSAEKFWAWCNRRNSKYPNIWDDFLHDWVDARCDGKVSLIDPDNDGYPTFWCRDSKGEEWSCNTPLVVVFDASARVRFEACENAFALDGSARSTAPLDWPSSDTPWLALDRNGNGVVDDGSELFGSATPMRSGGRAANGFEALAELDDDGDGRVGPEDGAWGGLLLWSDANGDGTSQRFELVRARDAGLVSIGLGYGLAPRCDARGSCERERGSFLWRDADGVREGAVVDVHVRTRRVR